MKLTVTPQRPDLETENPKNVAPGATKSDWIPWSGGEQPVPNETPVEVRFRGGHIDNGEIAEGWYWEQNGDERRPV